MKPQINDPGLLEPIEQSLRQPGLRRGLSIIHDRAAARKHWLTDGANIEIDEMAEGDDFNDEVTWIAKAAQRYRKLSDKPPIYMVRWLVMRIFGWELKFNLFLSSDPGCLHDHPWPFVSLMLAGAYTEHTQTGARAYRAPCVLFRPARWKHRIEIVEPCLTLNVSAPRRRNWGFWTPSGWIQHNRYKHGTHDC